MSQLAASVAWLFILLSSLPALAAPSAGDRRLPATVHQQVDQLKPQRPGVIDVYALIVGGDGAEDVFERESLTVKRKLEERFGAGRIVMMVNNRRLPQPEATLASIHDVIRSLADVMNKDEDLLYVHLTSHGAANHALVLSHPSQDLHWLGHRFLARILRDSGIRHRFIVISSCYSGGFIRDLAGETTVVVTASSASQQSYGCGNESEITDFSRAFYGSALASSRTLLEAARSVAQIVHEDEKRAGRKHSYPQSSIGVRMKDYLDRLEGQSRAHK